jgi:hypothetical protein
MKPMMTILVAATLVGCAHQPPLAASPPVPRHHVKKAVPVARQPVAAAPPVVAPAPKVAPPETFKHKWLRLFFRERALAKFHLSN